VREVSQPRAVEISTVPLLPLLLLLLLLLVWWGGPSEKPVR
jgi:hypothetical protein